MMNGSLHLLPGSYGFCSKGKNNIKKPQEQFENCFLGFLFWMIMPFP